jgi:hypothetical protein
LHSFPQIAGFQGIVKIACGSEPTPVSYLEFACLMIEQGEVAWPRKHDYVEFYLHATIQFNVPN